ncbi:(2,3-dihydroxybenzoyl)adenylate synthase [Vibrio nitrifigilis]|uniref:(2,3-dihydroxybenzoyl)adenylate synthase n=1 Tax=Vibrio nitrifigilis TaxID=2789781 RepID=A0ABS0GJ72_9VIBR|nr:(2,3-dihydroxybenzoyl)adenylate synthase [Vibrio nitrifigilis]MBF9002467.1 (2,3-dihydroxybenzoyl)adenylate synthase [Vibrio nitrifigilis]
MNDISMDEIEFTPWPEHLATKYRELGLWEGKTFYDYLVESANQFPENTAIICEDREYSYQAMVQEVGRYAAGFSDLGLVAGDNVVLQMTNTEEFFFCYFGLIQKGIRPVMALPAHRKAEISYFCQHAGAKAYIINGDDYSFDYKTLAQEVVQDAPSLQYVLVKGECDIADDRFIALDQCRKDPDYSQNTTSDKVAFFQLSGGTTGVPKMIPRTHDDYAYSVIGSNEICEIDENTRFLCVLPVAHNYVLSSPGTLGIFWAGGTVIVGDDPSPDAAFELIEEHEVDFVALVPPLALLWMETVQEDDDYDLSSLKVIQVGGAKFSETAAKKLPDLFDCQLQQVFGMAEGLVNYTRLDDPLEMITETQGRPISAYDEVRIVDEQGNEVAQGEEGFLTVQGPYTIRGYYKSAYNNERSFTPEGFYRTGDIVRMTAEGNLVVTGRDKDQINRGGEKIAAEEIENQLLRHPLVHDAALIAIPDEYMGERSCAVIVLTGEADIRPQDMKTFLRDCGLADFKIPDHVEFIAALPKTPVGKIDKKKLRTIYSTQLATTA